MKFTQQMSMHLNGQGFSQLHYKVLCDGEETGIVRHTATNGRPHYLKTSDKFECDGAVFDVLATNGKGLQEWLEARVAKKPHPPQPGTKEEES